MDASLTNRCVTTTLSALLRQVVPDGPASWGPVRIERGDLLREVDGVTVQSLAHSKELLLGHPGTPVTITLARNGYSFELRSAFHHSAVPGPRVC